MHKVMIDLEAMDTGPNAAIIAIGAVMFSDNVTGETFYRSVDLASSMEFGGTVSASTVMWWLEQSDEARQALTSGGAIHILTALYDLLKWLEDQCSDSNQLEVWGNGAAFDNVVLASAYDRSNWDRPWKFYNDRCYRTVKAMYPDIPVERYGTAHNALDDAITQALHLIKIKTPH